MDERILKKLIERKDKLKSKIDFFMFKKLLVKQNLDVQEIKGHLEKAKHNLQFVTDTSKEKYSDWVVVGCYYAVYHMVLSLILNKGYNSKNHDASLCILIQEYFKDKINLEEIELINRLFIDYNDLIFYVHSKNKREEATYSTKYKFDKNSVENLILKTRLFVAKVEEILRSDK